MKVNDKIKKLREKHNWSQEYVSEKLNIAPSSYARMERGETRLTLERLEQFAEIFNMSISDLIQNNQDNFLQLNEHTTNSCYIYNNLNSDESYQAEIEKQQLIIEHQAEMILQLKEQIQQLKKLNSALEQAK
ncbi:MAG: transcriptional regulator [Candidatus Delongbacteria bacterium]|nr:MAG: transcriptional regulator [Candidatus Delongbacteria bacterium]